MDSSDDALGARHRVRSGRRLALLGAALALLAACGEGPPPASRPPVEVTAVTVQAQDTPVTFEFVAQTQSSREVEIRARVAGFLERRLYTEGELVKEGQVLFQMDRQPFEAELLSAQGQLAQQEARLQAAKLDLSRYRPLAAKGAISKKELDDAISTERQARASVLSAQGVLRMAQLNLGYTTILSPLTGLSSFAKQQEGSYLTPGSEGLLTYVAQMDPIYVNFSISENELLKFRNEIAAGQLRFPPNDEFVVEVELADGSLVPERGWLNFADFSFSKETGTFLVRAVVANPNGLMRPGQFVRALILGASRPDAILLPQRAVLQGARSQYVWVIDPQGKPEQRVVEVGDWHGDDWFITQGLRAGERVVVDGAIRVSPGAPLKIVEAPEAARPGTGKVRRPAAGPWSEPAAAGDAGETP